MFVQSSVETAPERTSRTRFSNSAIHAPAAPASTRLLRPRRKLVRYSRALPDAKRESGGEEEDLEDIRRSIPSDTRGGRGGSDLKPPRPGDDQARDFVGGAP